MHIVYFANRYHTNQIPIVEYLLRNNHSVQFVVSRKANTEDYSLIEPIVCKEDCLSKFASSVLYKNLPDNVRENKLIDSFVPSLRWLFKFLLANRPDVVITRDTSFYSIVVYIVCKLLFIKNCILYTQEPVYVNPSEDKMSFKRHLIHKYLLPTKEFTPVIVSNSSFEYQQKHKSKRFFLPFVMSYHEDVRNRDYLKNGKINILDIGKYRPYKDHFVLLKAISILPLDFKKQIHVSIVGQVKNSEEEQYFDRMRVYIHEQKMENIVSLYKNIPYKEMDQIYLANDVFVLPSKRETASISILESMAHGLVTISSDKNGTASYIYQDCGFKFVHENVESLKNVLEYIIANKNKIAVWGKKTFDKSSKDYTAEKYYEGLINIINS